VAWWSLPAAGFFWLGLVAMLCFAWFASFGWREALRVIDTVIHRIERL